MNQNQRKGRNGCDRAFVLDFGIVSLSGRKPGLVGMSPNGDDPGLQQSAVFQTAYQPKFTRPEGGMSSQDSLEGP